MTRSGLELKTANDVLPVRSSRLGGWGRIRSRGTVLLLVMVTMLFAAMALLALIERASVDLLPELKAAQARDLRVEAYNALETSLAVIAQFQEETKELNSPQQGWGDPLAFAGYTPRAGLEVTVSLSDESGRLPLARMEVSSLVNVFKSWGLSDRDSERLADALKAWMVKDHVSVSGMLDPAQEYLQGALPYVPPHRTLRSFEELRAIAVAKDLLFDEQGALNEAGLRFTQAFSLYAYEAANINAAVPEVLAQVSLPDEYAQRRLQEYLTGTGMYEGRGPGYFRSAEEITSVLGLKDPIANVGLGIKLLRVRVEVREGASFYRLSVVVSPGGVARVPNDVREAAQKVLAKEGETEATATETEVLAPSATETVEKKDLRYPFTILEIRENDAMGSALL